MLNTTMTTLFVKDALASGAFYEDLLGRKPVDQMDAFVMFGNDGGSMLGLWATDTVVPQADGAAGGAELTIPVPSDADVDRTCADWKARGITIAQEPTTMPFGRTFVGLDPDGHRLRVFAQS